MLDTGRNAGYGNERSGSMAGTYGMRAVPLGPSCDLVVAGKSGMDGLWSAAHIFMILAGNGLKLYSGSGPLPTPAFFLETTLLFL